MNRPSGSSDQAGNHAVQAALGDRSSQEPDSQQHVFERQVQLSADKNMVIKIKPPSKTGSSSASQAQPGFLEEYEDTLWSDQQSHKAEGEPTGTQSQPSRPGRDKGSCSVEDPLLVCQKEPGKPRVVKSVSRVSDSHPELRRTVSESAIAVKGHFSSSALPPGTGVALRHKVGPHSAPSCGTQLPDQPTPSNSVVASARPALGPRQTQEPSLPLSCRTKFRKNNYKWVATSVKSPRVTRRTLSPRAALESVSRGAFGTAGKTEKPQPRANPESKSRKPAMSSKPGPSPSKYKWKASSPSASSSSSFHWHSEAGSRDHASQLSLVPSRSPPEDTPAVGSSSLKSLFGETPLSAYKVKSRTKIIRRRGNTRYVCLVLTAFCLGGQEWGWDWL